jgi:hypothetical protein
MTPLTGLDRGAGADLHHDVRPDFGQGLLRVPAAPALGADLVRPWVTAAGGPQHRAQLGRLGGAQRDGAADDQVAAQTRWSGG